MSTNTPAPAPLPTPSTVTTILKTARTYAIDLGERVASTFVVAAGGVLVTADAGTVGHVSFWEGVAAAGVAAGFSLLKGLIAPLFGDRRSASLAKNV